MRFKSLLRGGAALAAALLMAPGVRADTILAAATSLAQCSSSSGLADSTDALSCSQLSGGSKDDGTVTLLPFTGVTGHGTATPFVGSFTAFVVLDYSFDVIGGTPGDSVPLLIDYSLEVAATTFSYGFAEVVVNAPLIALDPYLCTDGLCNPGLTSSGTFSGTGVSGTVGTVNLEIEASAGYSSGTETASATAASPCIYVDPNFANAADYSVEVSAGVGNCQSSTATPEPGTLFLALLAVPALVFARRRLGSA